MRTYFEWSYQNVDLVPIERLLHRLCCDGRHLFLPQGPAPERRNGLFYTDVHLY